MLFLVPTPIGNLSDITLRALETLKSVDYILCEDTRTSGVLLKHYSIKKPLKSFHKFSEKRLEETVIEDLKNGLQVALISDAGMPGISDPGADLVKRLLEEGLKYTCLPGASAPLTALTLLGRGNERFQFLGFLPKKVTEKKELFIEAFYFPGVTLCFESPHRINKTLGEIAALDGERVVGVAREISKIYEEAIVGPVSDLIEREFRGEIVLMIEGHSSKEYSLPPKEHVEALQKEFDLSKQDAIKIAAKLRGVSKKDIYI